MKKILNIQNINKSFDGLELFRNANLCLQPNTINSLFGGNGMGKTTLFNMITGYDKIDSGRIEFFGENIQLYKEYQLVKKGIGRMWQNPTIFPNHTIIENLQISNKQNARESIFGFITRRKMGINDCEFQEKVNEVLTGIGLYSKKNAFGKSLSYGETKLLGLGMLICNNPKLYLLDEPFSNIGKKTIDIMCKHFETITQSGGTIFMIEHKTAIAQEISDNVFKIENKCLVALN